MEGVQTTTKANIFDVHKEWEDSYNIRSQLRDFGGVFRAAKREDLPHVNVQTAIINSDVLIPLAKRMGAPDGDVLMVSIPDLKTEFLGFPWLFFFHKSKPFF